MKISSVSKKVLASALSAAMVVAFAPTVAFGITAGDKIAVTVDLNGGNGTVPTYSEAVVGGDLALPTTGITYGAAKYPLLDWYYDSNKDGVINTDDNAWVSGTTKLPEQESITFKAVYDVPALALDATYKGFDDTASSGTRFILEVGKTNTQVTGLKLTMYGTDGGKVASIDNFSNVTSSITYAEFGVNGKNYSGNYASIAAGDVKPGTYTFKLTDAKGEVLGTKTLELYKVTVVTKSGTTETKTDYTKSKGGTVDLDPGSTGLYFVNAAGQIVTGNYTVKGAETLTQVDISKGLVTAGAYDENTRKMSFDVVTPGDSATYVLSVKDSAGTVVFTKNIAAGTDTTAALVDPISFSFNSKATGVELASKAEVAGTYTATLTRTTAAANGNVGTTASISSTVALTEVKYTIADGVNWAGGVTDAQKDVFTDLVGWTPATIGSMAVQKDNYTLATEWELNGKTYNATTNPLVAGTVNTMTATAKADDLSKKIATPALVSVEKDAAGTYTVKLSCATAGAQILVAVNSALTPATPYDVAKGIQTVADTDTITAIAKPVAGATPAALTQDSLLLTLSPAVNDTNIKDYKALAKDGSLEYFIGTTSTKWAAADSIKAAVDAGNAAVAAVVFDTDDNLKALAAVQSKAVYEAVLAEAKAQLAPYADEALVVVGDKAVSIAAKDLKAANDAITEMEAYITGKGANVTAAQYSTAIAKYVTETNKALKAAKDSGLKAADIAAAQTVTSALKAATTGADAEAALAQYEALTADQKKLVATADVVAAQEIVAAAELKDAQDDAAVSKARNASKTVKAGKNGKTTKKQSVTLKKITSASGAKVTYKKASGKKAITVKSGKAYLAKGVKKGTYKATVKATCGTQTAKITVTFKVK